ncbi:hypothetical protein [Allosalinactinospora lopnorensis]|uniref:hypothetical protein n=1 Tax=Allosalinactinospora lopnorensis TaxID=1352348 RepID=UPI0012E22788|nr:hypothetical protein [Allosalinactinospora lopnorensis]
MSAAPAQAAQQQDQTTEGSSDTVSHNVNTDINVEEGENGDTEEGDGIDMVPPPEI